MSGSGLNGAAATPTLAALHALTSRVKDYDKTRAAQRLQDAALRGAFAGVAVRGGLHLVTYLLHLLLSGKRKKGSKGRGAAGAGGGGGPDAAVMLKDTARWGAFLGTFSGGFVLFDELIAMLGGRRRTAAWRAMAAGTLAGPALLLTGSKQAHTSLALYVFVRGLVLLVRCGNMQGAHPLKRKLLAPTRWAHGDLVLMSLSTAQLAYSWMVLPQTLPPSFVRFLNKHGGKQLHVYAAIQEMCQRTAAGLGAAPLAALAGTEHQGFCGATACPVIHPGQGCVQHMAGFFPASYIRSLPVYFPVYVIPAILVHRKKLMQPDTAPELWRKLGMGVLRSSLFLSLYCTIAWGGVCAGHNLAGRTSGPVFAATCWTGALAVLVEKRSRRMELALYLFSRAVESFALSAVVWGVVRPGALPRRMDVLLFSLACGFILHCYSDHFGERRDVFRSAYTTVFDFILGNTGFDCASIRHQPSNADILLRGVRSVKSMGSLLLRGGSGAGRGGAGGGGTPSPSPSPQPGLSPEGSGLAAAYEDAEAAAGEAIDEAAGAGTP